MSEGAFSEVETQSQAVEVDSARIVGDSDSIWRKGDRCYVLNVPEEPCHKTKAS